MKKIVVFVCAAALAASTVTFCPRGALAQKPAPKSGSTPSEYIPNDPSQNLDQARAIELLKAYQVILDRDAAPKMPQGITVFMEEAVDTSLPEFVGVALPQFSFDTTGRPSSGSFHATFSAGTGAAKSDNGMGTSSPTIRDRLRFISGRVCDGNLCRSEWLLAGFREVLRLKRTGLPITTIGCNFVGGVTLADADAMDQVLRDLAAEGINIVAPGNDAGPTINLDDVLVFPGSYSRFHDNVITVAPADETGERLHPMAALGPKTYSVALPSVNLRTVSPNDPMGAGSAGGSSAITHRLAVILTLIRVYREPDAVKARFVLKFTARMYPELEGKLNATPGDTDDAGRMAGKVDVYDALTMEVGCPAQSSSLMWVTKRDSNRLVAVDSVRDTAGPFAVDSEQNFFAPDKRTRLKLFAYNVPTDSTLVQVNAVDSTGHAVPLPVENLGRLTGELSCLTQINVKLMPLAPGDVRLTIVVNTQTTSEGTITIKP